MMFCALFFLLCGLMLGALAWNEHHKFQQLRAGFRKATGEIVLLDRDKDGWAYPTVRFSLATGEQVKFWSDVNSNSYQPGQRVSVLYEEAKPEEALIDEPEAFHSALLSFQVAAAFCLLFAAWFGLLALSSGC